ncbi:MAG: transketolase [Synergistes sp.]|nr:transketolase [Synergistes sp.]
MVNGFEDIPSVIRREVLDLAWQAKKSHLGGALSCVDILTALYCGSILRYDVGNPEAEDRDRFIMSKGHGSMALYAILNYVGFISDDELAGFHTAGHFLQVHPSINLMKGIEISGGSLGQGLPLSCGIAKALKMKGNFKSRVFCLLGDGEINEGSIWEAAAFASANALNNLIAIVDCNKLQHDDMTEKVLPFAPIGDKWKAFGFDVIECDGHSPAELVSALSTRGEKPLAVIAHTVKGKGLSFVENVPAWHYSELSKKMYERGIEELQRAK